MDARLVLSGIMIIGCTLSGRAFAGFYGRRSKLCSELLDALRMLRISIADRMEPVGDALKKSSSVLLSRIPSEISEKCDIASAWRKIRQDETKRGGLADCFGEKELRILDNLFSEIGVSSCEEQRVCIHSCIAEFELLADEAKRDFERTEKLYTYMGMLLGLAMAVMTV